VLDIGYDREVAVRNTEEFVAKQTDLALEFQVEEAAAPRVAHIFKKADIPLVAIYVPHPNATCFGVDNFEVGYEAASVKAQYAQKKWNGNVDRVVGVGFSEADSFVQNRIAWAFDGIKERFQDLAADRFVQDGCDMREVSHRAMTDYLRTRPAATGRWAPPPTTPVLWEFLTQCARLGRKQTSPSQATTVFPKYLKRCARVRARLSARSRANRRPKVRGLCSLVFQFCAGIPCSHATTCTTAP
jgi:ribose transport system substrate-binding protein